MKNKAQQLLQQMCDAYKQRNMALMLSLFTSNASMWGSGIDEYRLGLKQIEQQLLRDWAQSEASEIIIVSFVPSTAEDLWAAALCQAKITINGEEHLIDELRGTIIIAQEDNRWKISHMHASFPDYRNPEEGSFPIS